MEAVMVIGVDTHKDGHSAALVNAVGAVKACTEAPATLAGYRWLWAWAEGQGEPRLWAVEGTGSYGAGLADFLQEHGELVIEGDHPKRESRTAAGKSDQLDAIRVAREALARPHHAIPKRRGEREMIRVLLTAREGAVEARKQGLNQLYALVVTAPDNLRQRLGRLRGQELVKACLGLRARSDRVVTVTASTLHSVARRVQTLGAEADDYERQLTELIKVVAPTLLSERGVGPLIAAQIIVSWSHAGRIRTEAAFAALAGVAPVPASSGRIQRHRLNRMGDRRLNRALHFIALTRASHDQATKAYITRRTEEGKSSREIRRCLKRYIARRLFRLLEGLDKT